MAQTAVELADAYAIAGPALELGAELLTSMGIGELFGTARRPRRR